MQAFDKISDFDMATDGGGAQYHSRALERGLLILERLSGSTSGSESLAELHALTDLPKSTLLRLLGVLERHGFVRSINDGARYRLGHAVVGLAESYRRGANLTEAAKRFLDPLAHDTYQTANLGVLDGGMVLHLVVCEPPRSLRFRSSSGSRDDVHCTGLGKMLLAGIPSDDARSLLLSKVPLEARTDRTLTDVDLLMEEIDRVRTRGFAIDSEEGARGVCCLAVPIRLTGGSPDRWVASISLSGPLGEMCGAERDQLLNQLGRTAEQMSGNAEFKAALEFSQWGAAAE